MDFKMILLTELFILICITTCNAMSNSRVPQRDMIVNIPSFNKVIAYSFNERKLFFGHKSINSIGHKEFRNENVFTILRLIFEVMEQDFQMDIQHQGKFNATNIIARYESDVIDRVLLCTHFDTRIIAENGSIRIFEHIYIDDGRGSGFSGLLELSRNINQCSNLLEFDINIFEAKEQGLNLINQEYSWELGAQYWYLNLHDTPNNVKFGVLIDMVGAKSATFRKEGHSFYCTEDMPNTKWSLANGMHLSEYVINESTYALTGDYGFIMEKAKLPWVNYINVEFNERFRDHQHIHNDIIEIVDKANLLVFAQTLLDTIMIKLTSRIIHYK